jgi:hypothetical protein
LGIDVGDLLIVVPERLTGGDDGPCHPPEVRKRFWTDVLKSLELSYETLFEEARLQNAKAKEVSSEGYIKDLEERIRQIQATLETT